jgi:hypothetical protein
MADQKKKSQFADLTDYADKENLRTTPAQNGKSAKTKRTYHAETLGLPPLKMVLVHSQNDRANEAAKSKKSRTKKEAVISIIEHLTKV